MPNQILKSPGFYDREIDLTTRTVQPTGVPAAIIGATSKGPAFIPITLGSFSDFQTKFGNLDPKYAAPYMVDRWLKNSFAATFIRVLGAGANTIQTEMDDTRTKGIVKNAGFKLTGSAVSSTDKRYVGSSQFLVAKHTVTGSEVYGMPMFSDNGTFFTTGSSSEVYLVRAMIFNAYDTRIMVMSASETFNTILDDQAQLDNGSTSQTYRKFKLVISSSAGSTFSTTDGVAGVKILTASLNPSDSDYVGKILNTDPDKFETAKHLLYCDFAVDNEIASITSTGDIVAIVSGSSNTSSTSGDTSLTLRDAFGRFDTRYTTPHATWIISQPFGQTEHNLFYFETLDDGNYGNNKYKISIANVKASTDPTYDYGSFSVLVRNFTDTDAQPEIIEQFNNLSLDPSNDNYIAKIIGDMKVYFNFDVVNPEDRRLIKTGNNPNKSKYIRVILDAQVDRAMSPKKALPFGFRGPSILNTNTTLTDGLPTGGVSGSFIRLGMSGSFGVSGSSDQRLLAAVLPPIPYRFKVTRGEVSASSIFEGYPGPTEIVDTRLFWGVKFERNTNVLNPNISNEPNPLIESLTKFQGISKLDTLVTGSKTDDFNNNKFTLARVALSNTTLSDVTASAMIHMREAAYIRNGTVDPSDYTIADTIGNRITLASLIMKSTATDFNRFSDFTKFTMFLHGGWDGTNILDKNNARLNDKATSTETSGGANGSYVSPGFATNQNGVGRVNNSIFSFQTAVTIITDPILSQHNLLSLPGIREPFVMDDARTKTRDHSLSMLIEDLPYYDGNATRIFDGELGRYIDVLETADNFESRAIDNEAGAAYFPNVVLTDATNNRKVTVPASVAAMSALAYNDRVSFPWYAPAGYNRAALEFVESTQVRLPTSDQNRLIDVHINPIIKYPGSAYVINAQNTLQQARSARSSINIKRMILEVKRGAVDIGNRIIFSQISQETRDILVTQLKALLASIATRGGIQVFDVICDDRNNTKEDAQNNSMNCQIRLVPTYAVEYVVLDFIVTNSGVSFSA